MATKTPIDYTKAASESIAQYNNRIASARGLAPANTVPALPTAPTGNLALQGPYNVNSLNSTNLSLAPTIPQTAAAGGMAFLENQSKGIQGLLQEQQTRALGLQQQNVKNQEGLSSIYQQLIDAPNRAEDIRADAGVDDLLNTVNNYTNQIESEQMAVRRQTENLLRNNPTGALQSGLQTEVNRVERESLSKQADLAVLQAGAARNYDAASAAADRKIAAETETLKTALDAQKFFYQENKGELTKAEDRIWQVQLAEEERKIEEITANKKMAQNAIIGALAAGAPTSVIQQAQAVYNQGGDPTEVAAVLGQYSPEAVAIQAQRASIAASQASTANSYDAIRSRREADALAAAGVGDPPTQAELLVSGYAERVVDANKTISSLGNKFAAPIALGGTTIFGIGIPNALKSADRQQYEQAQRNFVNAVLRRESGAAIADSEFESAKVQYFPRAGDSPAVVAQKQRNRQIIEQNLIRTAGTAMPLVNTGGADPLGLF